MVGFLMYCETAFAAYCIFDDMVWVAYAVKAVIGSAFFMASADDGKLFAVAWFGFIVEIVGVKDMAWSASDVFFSDDRIFAGFSWHKAIFKKFLLSIILFLLAIAVKRKKDSIERVYFL
jgi:hypothetical protein